MVSKASCRLGLSPEDLAGAIFGVSLEQFTGKACLELKDYSGDLQRMANEGSSTGWSQRAAGQADALLRGQGRKGCLPGLDHRFINLSIDNLMLVWHRKSTAKGDTRCVLLVFTFHQINFIQILDLRWSIVFSPLNISHNIYTIAFYCDLDRGCCFLSLRFCNSPFFHATWR